MAKQADVYMTENLFTKPYKFNAKLCVNTVVSMKMEHIYPKKPLCDHYVNNYKNNRI